MEMKLNPIIKLQKIKTSKSIPEKAYSKKSGEKKNLDIAKSFTLKIKKKMMKALSEECYTHKLLIKSKRSSQLYSNSRITDTLNLIQSTIMHKNLNKEKNFMKVRYFKKYPLL
jgi:hypothetical protein